MAKQRITISVDPDMLARIRTAAEASATADSVSAQIVHYVDLAERVEERWTPSPVPQMLPIPALLVDQPWRTFADPRRATTVMLHSSGLWVEFDAELFDMVEATEAQAIASAMRAGAYLGTMAGRCQVVVTSKGDGYSAVLEVA